MKRREGASRRTTIIRISAPDGRSLHVADYADEGEALRDWRALEAHRLAQGCLWRASLSSALCLGETP
jgi:hypothetical protein